MLDVIFWRDLLTRRRCEIWPSHSISDFRFPFSWMLPSRHDTTCNLLHWHANSPFLLNGLTTEFSGWQTGRLDALGLCHDYILPPLHHPVVFALNIIYLFYLDVLPKTSFLALSFFLHQAPCIGRSSSFHLDLFFTSFPSQLSIGLDLRRILDKESRMTSTSLAGCQTGR